MKDEILAAVLFLVRFIEKSEKFSRDKLDAFKSQLIELLTERFQNHWFPDCPAKGQGYRCIRVNELHPVDVVLQKAATQVGLSYNDLQLPIELTLWVDPNEVCCRFGESEGSYCTLATFSEKENQFMVTSESPLSTASERSVSPASSDASSSSSSGSSSIENHSTNINGGNVTTNNINTSHNNTYKYTSMPKRNQLSVGGGGGVGTPRKYRNKNSISPTAGGYNNFNKYSLINAPNLVQRGNGGGIGNGNRTQQQSISIQSPAGWRSNYYDILPHFAQNGSPTVSTPSQLAPSGAGGYNHYNHRSNYPRVSQFQNIVTV